MPTLDRRLQPWGDAGWSCRQQSATALLPLTQQLQQGVVAARIHLRHPVHLPQPVLCQASAALGRSQVGAQRRGAQAGGCRGGVDVQQCQRCRLLQVGEGLRGSKRSKKQGQRWRAGGKFRNSTPLGRLESKLACATRAPPSPLPSHSCQTTAHLEHAAVRQQLLQRIHAGQRQHGGAAGVGHAAAAQVGDASLQWGEQGKVLPRGQQSVHMEGNGRRPGRQAGRQAGKRVRRRNFGHLELRRHRGLHALQIQLGGVVCRSIWPQQLPRCPWVLQLPAQPHACRAGRRGRVSVKNRCWRVGNRLADRPVAVVQEAAGNSHSGCIHEHPRRFLTLLHELWQGLQSSIADLVRGLRQHSAHSVQQGDAAPKAVLPQHTGAVRTCRGVRVGRQKLLVSISTHAKHACCMASTNAPLACLQASMQPGMRTSSGC